MTTDDILTLAKAGFTADQIAALNKLSSPATPPTPAPVAAPAAPVAPVLSVPAAPVAPAAPAAPVIPAVTDPTPAAPAAPTAPADMQQILSAVNGLSKQMQSAALLTASQNVMPETTEQILASIINPPTKDK